MAVHTFETMGTVVSIRLDDVVDEVTQRAAITEVEAVFADLNNRFSLYLPNSEASLIARGEMALTEASAEMRDAYAESLAWRDATAGAFTPHRPDGVIDLSGTIKAAGIRAATEVLDGRDLHTFSVNVGGDIMTRGVPSDGAWITGIAHPLVPGELVSVISLTPEWPAVATSGTAERGEHIWRRPDTDTSFIQATVVATDIMTADVLATALISGGQDTLAAVTARGDVGVLIVKANGELLANEAYMGVVTPSG